MIFSPNIIRTDVFDQSKTGNEHAANFQNKMYIKFLKI